MIRAAEQDRRDVKQKRVAWAARIPGLDPDKLAFRDETGANMKMTVAHGGAPVGERVVRHGHRTTTVVAALRSDGLVTPMVPDGEVNGDAFVA